MVSLKKNGQSGFTIVELLIVIVIIGILAGLVITQILGATSKARDTDRKADLDQMTAQLEAYFTNTGGYPSAPDLGNATWRTNNQVSMGDQNKSMLDPSVTVATAPANYTFATNLTPTAIGPYAYVPTDAAGSTTCSSPTTNANPPGAGTPPFCVKFTLAAFLEAKNDPSATNGVYTKKSSN